MTDTYPWIYLVGIDKNVRSCPGAFEAFTCAGCGKGPFYKKVGTPWKTCSRPCSRSYHDQQRAEGMKRRRGADPQGFREKQKQVSKRWYEKHKAANSPSYQRILARSREISRRQRETETPERRAARLEKMRAYTAQYRAAAKAAREAGKQ